MARLFNLPETRGTVKLAGKVTGASSDKFYQTKETKNGGTMRLINFGLQYAPQHQVYVNLTGMPRDKVYFSKRNENGKTETKAIKWTDRNKFNEDGYRMIGINCGLQKKTGEVKKGESKNINHTLVEFDACDYLHEYLQNDQSVFINAKTEFSSYVGQNGEVKRNARIVPTQISLANDIDFESETFEPRNNFLQRVVFESIEKEKDADDRDTGRFVINAFIVNYSSIETAAFIVEDKSLALGVRKMIKPYTAIDLEGVVKQQHVVVETEDDGMVLGAKESKMSRAVGGSSRIEWVVTRIDLKTADTDTYTEDAMYEAMAKVRNSKTAEANFGGKDDVVDNFADVKETEEDDDEGLPWD